MDDETRPPGGADTMLAPRPSTGDDASIVWLRDPADDEPAADLRDEGPQRSASRLWTDAGAQEFRDRWRAVQVRFVDDPVAAVRDAEALVVSATEQLAATLTAGRDECVRTDDDTEQLRLAVRRYRELLDRILEL